MSVPLNSFQRFIHRNSPSRDEVLASPWLKPFGQRIAHSELWRFTRRSVPRAVFAGLFIGIFLMVPGLQIVGAALMAMPMRANIPIAAAMTFLSNPLTTPFFLLAAIDVGDRAWRGARWIYCVACRMALVGRTEMASAWRARIKRIVSIG